MELIVLGAVVLIGLVVFSSFSGPAPATPALPDPPPTPEQLIADISTLGLRAEIVMNAVEIEYRTKHFHREAEGAKQMRTAIREFLAQEIAKAQAKTGTFNLR